jgi:hypothetical protein
MAARLPTAQKSNSASKPGGSRFTIVAPPPAPLTVSKTARKYGLPASTIGEIVNFTKTLSRKAKTASFIVRTARSHARKKATTRRK